jgi:hypothetical protein
MDSIRRTVETAVRRLATIGLLLIATLLAAAHWRLDVAAVLLAAEALLLLRLSWAAPSLPLERAPAWMLLPGSDRGRRPVYARLLAEALRSYAERLGVAATIVWAAAMLSNMPR